MLTQIRIQNFRSCQDVRIERLGPVAALVGRNGAGKSNILHAVARVAKIATSTDPIKLSEFVLFDNPTPHFSVTLDFDAGGSSYCYQLGMSLSSQPDHLKPVIQETLERVATAGRSYLIQREGGIVRVEDRSNPLPIGELSPCLTALATLMPSSDHVVVDLKAAISFLSRIRYYPLDEPGAAGRAAGAVSGTQYAAWLSSYDATGNAGESVLFRLIYMSLRRTEDFTAVKLMVGPQGLGLIDDIEVSTINMAKQPSSVGSGIEDVYYIVRFVPSRGTTVSAAALTADNLSLGTRRVLRMLVSMIFDASTVMLLEQPEDGLHQGLTKKLIGLLAQNSSPTQLIMSSHSSALLNKLKPEDIRLVSLHDGLTIVRQLTPTEINTAIRFMNQEGPLYDFLETIQED